jgi:hypothetical protein
VPAWRIEDEGALYQLAVIGWQRGGDIFVDERDRHSFLKRSKFKNIHRKKNIFLKSIYRN